MSHTLHIHIVFLYAVRIVDSQREVLRKAYKRTVAFLVAYAVIGIACLIYVESVTAKGPVQGVLDPETALPFRIAFVVLGLSFFLLARIVRFQILFGKMLPSLSSRADRAPAHIRRLVLSTVVSHAFYLGIMALGLILFLASGKVSDFYALFGGSIALIAVNFPRIAEWEAWEKQSSPE